MSTSTAKKNIVLLASFSILFLSAVSVNAQTYRPEEKDSIYLYYALENRASVEDMLTNQVAILDVEEENSRGEQLSPEEKLRIQEEKASATYLELVEKQEMAIEKATHTRLAVENKSGLRTTVLGNNLGTLEFHLVQIKGLQSMYNSLLSKTSDVPLKMQIKAQIETLADEQKKIENTIILREEKDRFSLLGWLVATL